MLPTTDPSGEKARVEKCRSRGRTRALEKVNRTGASRGRVLRVARVYGVGRGGQFGASGEPLLQVSTCLKGVLGGLVRTAHQTAEEVGDQEDKGHDGHHERRQGNDERGGGPRVEEEGHAGCEGGDDLVEVSVKMWS